MDEKGRRRLGRDEKEERGKGAGVRILGWMDGEMQL
jgi:hypothetical protein